MADPKPQPISNEQTHAAIERFEGAMIVAFRELHNAVYGECTADGDVWLLKQGYRWMRYFEWWLTAILEDAPDEAHVIWAQVLPELDARCVERFDLHEERLARIWTNRITPIVPHHNGEEVKFTNEEQ